MIANDYAEIAKTLAKLAEEKRQADERAANQTSAPEPDPCDFSADENERLLTCGGWI
jgi:hypothetical protein